VVYYGCSCWGMQICSSLSTSSRRLVHLACFLSRILGGPIGAGRHRILLEDVVAIWIGPLDPEDHLLPQKVLINIGVDSFSNASKNEQTFLVITAQHFQDHLLQTGLREGSDADAGLHVSNREVCQVSICYSS
jgi:hypothetical protein